MRTRMNEYLGIRRDNDITSRPRASEQEVEAFETGRRPPPTLKPMCVDWGAGSTSTWNQSLFTDFYQDIQDIMMKQAPPIQAAKSEVEDIFYSRLECLRKLINASQARDNEDEEAVVARLAAKAGKNRRSARRRMRRQQVSGINTSFIPPHTDPWI
jgi:hypothetical protein